MTPYQRAWNVVRVTLPCPRKQKKCKAPRLCRLCAEAVRAIQKQIVAAEDAVFDEVIAVVEPRKERNAPSTWLLRNAIVTEIRLLQAKRRKKG